MFYPDRVLASTFDIYQSFMSCSYQGRKRGRNNFVQHTLYEVIRVDIELEVGSIPVIPLVQEEICPDGNFLLSSPSGKNYEWYVGNAPSITPVSDLSVNAEGLYSFIEQIPDGVNACSYNFI